jgi:hypothetical protein
MLLKVRPASWFMNAPFVGAKAAPDAKFRPPRIEAKSERPAHPSRQFFPFEKIAARWIAFAHRLR